MQHTNSSASVDEEYLIDITQLWQIIRQSWRLIVTVTLLCASVAVMLTFVLPKKWEAVATIRIGHLPLDGSSNQFKLLEDPKQTVERLKLREFKEKVLSAMGLPVEDDVDDRSELVIETLKGGAIKDTEFVNLTIRGYSKLDAEHALEAAVKELQSEHAAIIAPIQKGMLEELQRTKDQVAIVSADVKAINDKMQLSGIYKTNAEFAPSIVAINLLATKEAEVSALKIRVANLNVSLTALAEQSTKVINKIQVGKYAVFPKNSLFLGAGLFLGLLLGLGLALLRKPKLT